MRLLLGRLMTPQEVDGALRSRQRDAQIPLGWVWCGTVHLAFLRS